MPFQLVGIGPMAVPSDPGTPANAVVQRDDQVVVQRDGQIVVDERP